MRSTIVLVLALVGVGMAGCKGPGVETQTRHGRYAGVGLYSPGELWAKMTAAAPSGDPAQARTGDDEQVIVVVDGETGEIRQCGNLSGYCVGMNPWTRALLHSQSLPVSLSAHAADHAISNKSASH